MRATLASSPCFFKRWSIRLAVLEPSGTCDALEKSMFWGLADGKLLYYIYIYILSCKSPVCRLKLWGFPLQTVSLPLGSHHLKNSQVHTSWIAEQTCQQYHAIHIKISPSWPKINLTFGNRSKKPERMKRRACSAVSTWKPHGETRISGNCLKNRLGSASRGCK